MTFSKAGCCDCPCIFLLLQLHIKWTHLTFCTLCTKTVQFSFPPTCSHICSFFYWFSLGLAWGYGARVIHCETHVYFGILRNWALNIQICLLGGMNENTETKTKTTVSFLVLLVAQWNTLFFSFSSLPPCLIPCFLICSIQHNCVSCHLWAHCYDWDSFLLVNPEQCVIFGCHTAERNIKINLRSSLFCLLPTGKENKMPNKRLPSRAASADYDIWFWEEETVVWSWSFTWVSLCVF